MNYFRRFITRYTPQYTTALIYMMQANEYEPKAFWDWYCQVSDWRKVTDKRNLVMTTPTKILLIFLVVLQVVLYGWALVVWFILETTNSTEFFSLVGYDLLWILAVPILSALILLAVVFLARTTIYKVFVQWQVKKARSLFGNSSALKIAVAGSYGKTTMKHILDVVLSVGKKVASTEGNYNTPIGLYRFAKKLTGDEEVLVIEMGESALGDIKLLARIANPTIGVITGINEQHMMRFGNIENTINTVFELDDYLGPKGLLFVNSESANIKKRLRARHKKYSILGADGWKISKVVADLSGTNFSAKKGKRTLKVKTQLLGEHQVGPLICAISIADRLGISEQKILKAIESIEPFKLRFAPVITNGGTVIYDIYNGNPAGFYAGIKFLNDLPTSQVNRKVYVTPGIIELGYESERIHREIGVAISQTKFDEVVLVSNRVTDWIHEELINNGFKEKVRVIDDGPTFYDNIDKFISKKDVIILQNSPREDFFYSQE